MTNNNLKKEAKCFDRINRERARGVKSILVNDDRTEEYFYKNPWRYGFSRKYAFGRILEGFKEIESKFPLHILEIGCGNGWFSLNANLKNKDYWDCFDISGEAISAANFYRDQLKIEKNQYFVTSLGGFKSDKKYDVIVCINILHHLTDLNKFYSKIRQYLKNNGCVYIHDVTSDLFNEQNASFVFLLRKILEAGNKVKYFEKIKEKNIDKAIEDIIFEWTNETDDKKQSINDHFHSTKDIRNFLQNKFKTVFFKEEGGILMRLLGGLRGKPSLVKNFVGDLIKIEEYLKNKKIINPYNYTFIGKIKKHG